MIALAKQHSAWVRVFDEHNHQLFDRPGELVGYTSDTVSIRQGNYIRVVDEKNHIKFTRHVSA